MRILFLRIVFMFTFEKKPFHNHRVSSLLVKDYTGNYHLIYDSENDWDKEKSALDFKKSCLPLLA